MNFHLKNGVSAVGCKVETAIALMQATSVYADFDLPLVVTSLTEGKHRRGSRHFYGYAADFRVNESLWGGVPEHVLPDLLDALRDELEPSGWEVILESDPPHIHIELELTGEN